MNKISFLLLLLIISLSIYADGDANDNATDDNAYTNAQSTGWFWYREKYPQEIKKPKKPKLDNSLPVQPVQSVPMVPVAPGKSQSKSELFSASWVREKLPMLLDKAISNPNQANVTAYKYVERIAVDMASNFADMSAKVLKQEPMLDESVRFPISAMARQQALWQVSQAKKAIMQDLTTKVGLWVFFDSKCHYCYTQFSILSMFTHKYPNIEVRYISTDGGVFPGMQNMQGMNHNKVLFDKNGQMAKQLGIKLTPATVMVVPYLNKLAIISHGAMPVSELEQKIVTAAIDMNITDTKLSDIATLEDRGILSNHDLQKIREQIRNPEDSDELVKMLNQMINSKM